MSDKKGATKGKKQLPPELEEKKTRVRVTRQAPQNANLIEDPQAFAAFGVDNSFSMEHFRDNFRIDVQEIAEDSMVFDVIGVDPPVANALRRILIAEVPSMAIETVKLFQNTSVIQDEVLSHRLGLIPILADPRDFSFVYESPNEEPTELTTLVFTLDVTCSRNPQAPANAPKSEQFINDVVLTKHLQWVPQGRQAKVFKGREPRPVFDDIVIAKLRPGQQIEAELHVEKGIGKTHAKWSPVATASYRLLPEIDFLQPVKNELADELVKKCPMRVFDIEDLDNGDRRAVVARPRSCTMCRECIREDDWSQRVALKRVRDHFIFSIETTGAGPSTPQEIFREAVKILGRKAKTMINEIETVGDKSNKDRPVPKRGIRIEDDDDEEEI